MAENDGGVLISDGRCSIRLTRYGSPTELGYPTIIDVCAGPFVGSVRDGTVGFDGFREELETLYERLQGRARLDSYEGFELDLVGDGKGAIGIIAKVIGAHVPLIALTFEFSIDQSYLPPIIRQLDIEFPPPYRVVT